MNISETKKKIVIKNYFEQDCNLDTSIRQAYERGFNRGLQKAPKPHNNISNETIQNIIDEMSSLINDKTNPNGSDAIKACIHIMKKYTHHTDP